MDIKKILLTFIVATSSLGVVNTMIHADVAQAPLAYSTTKQLQLTELDSLGRAVNAHIQLTDADEPTDKREPTLNYNPTGWHNYQLPSAVGSTTKAWLFNRGHLVGYQFSGLNDEKKNLTIETAYLNQGSITGPNASNQAAMLFYENKLDAWLAAPEHKTWHLDYQVTPIYSGNELVPRKVRLAYVGYDQNGAVQPIKLATALEKTGVGQATVVTLDNVSANANINYANGTATAIASATGGWHTISGGTYYIKTDGSKAKGFYTLGKTLFYFDNNGWQYKNRWFKVGNYYYHINAGGAVARGFVKVGSQNYYFDNSGKQYKNRWFKVGNYYYWVNGNGYVVRNFNNISGQRYYFDKNGRNYRNRWFKISGAVYHADGNGKLARGLKNIGKHKYFFLNGSARQVTNKTNYWISGKKYNISKQGYVSLVPTKTVKKATPAKAQAAVKTNNYAGVAIVAKATGNYSVKVIKSNGNVIGYANKNVTVYVATGGSAKVYWFNTAKMPKTTNLKNVKKMTLQAAVNNGKKLSATQ
ncbi:MAG: DNA/RNA non-specific endonuclease [Lactobacillaceae bacterium]|jgi:DNA-entry nuclease|nr:DNA/RNA non-specific endonuclease [Lactobacillaceae bacterium]